jgi:hypothetical protein
MVAIYRLLFNSNTGKTKNSAYFAFFALNNYISDNTIMNEAMIWKYLFQRVINFINLKNSQKKVCFSRKILSVLLIV